MVLIPCWIGYALFEYLVRLDGNLRDRPRLVKTAALFKISRFLKSLPLQTLRLFWAF